MDEKKTAPLPDYVPAGEELRAFYLKSSQKLERRMLAAGGSLARTRMMSYIDRHAQVRSIDLMEAFGHAPRTVTEALDALERDGLIQRLPDPTDRRAKIVTLTAPGKQLLTDTEPLLRVFADELFTVLAPAEMAQLTTLLARLNAQLAQMD